MFCPNCGKINDDNSEKCSRCNYHFYDLERNEIKEEKVIQLSRNTVLLIVNLFMIFCGGTFFLAGLVLTMAGVSGAYSSYIIKDYEEIEAYKTSTSDCEDEDGIEICIATFRYTIDGNNYTATSSYKDNFDWQETIYYNPNNPSEYKIVKITEGWEVELAIGLAMVIAVIIIFVKVNISIIIAYKKDEERKKEEEKKKVIEDFLYR